MRLSSLCVAAVRFPLALAVILFFSSPLLAQHGGGGGGSSSGSSYGGSSAGGSSAGGSSGGGSGGGGSQGGGSSGGGSSSSGGGHSSGGGSSGGHNSGGGHGSSGSSWHSSSGSVSRTGGDLSRSIVEGIRTGSIGVVDIRAVSDSNVRVVLDRESTRQVLTMVKARDSEQQIRAFIRMRANWDLNPFGPKVEPPQHRGFFGLLRHPFRKAEVIDLRHRICLSGSCVVCPIGQAHMIGGGCGGAASVALTRRLCSTGTFGNGGSCGTQNFPDDCRGLRQALEQQARRLQEAESAQQNACVSGPSQVCSDTSNTAQNEGSHYRALLGQYRMCRQRAVSTSPFSGGHVAVGYSSR